jgi:hypothetical protein
MPEVTPRHELYVGVSLFRFLRSWLGILFEFCP